MHYTAIVIIPPAVDPTDAAAVGAAVAAALAPFDENLEVAPHKEYLGAADIEGRYGMAEAYSLQPDDLPGLAAHMRDWNNQEGGVDALGLFGWSTSNPCGKWDWYEIGGRWAGMPRDNWRITTTYLDGNACRLRDLPAYNLPESEGPHIGTHDVVLSTPTPAWLGRGAWVDSAREFQANPRYPEQVADLCRRYPDSLGVLVEYHR